MTKTISKLLILLVCVASAFAQNPIVSTTLSTTLTAGATLACVASATSITVPALASGVVGSIFLIDAEVMQVTGAGPTSTCFRVKRGLYPSLQSNSQVSHAASQKVWVMGATISTGDTSRPISTATFLSQRPFQPYQVVTTPAVNGVAPGSVTDVNGTIFYTALEVDFNMIATGACLLNGATVTTDKHIVALYDATGTLLANSALAGLADSGASVYQCQSFVSPVAILGPAQYFIATQANGTTDNFQTYATGGAAAGHATGSQTGTFGTLPAIAVTTTFTAAKGPLMILY